MSSIKDANMKAKVQLIQLLERHCASLTGEISLIGEKLAQAILTPKRYAELGQGAVEIVHKINGSSGSLGFRALSSAASKFEDALNESIQSVACPDEAEIRELHRLFSEIQKISEQTTPETSYLYGIDLEQVGNG